VRPHLCDRFIFITAHQETPRIKEFLTQVPEMVLRKPFHLDDLLAMVGRLMHRLATQPQAPGVAAAPGDARGDTLRSSSS
jgi:DNA-binding response OmpR family regulator